MKFKELSDLGFDIDILPSGKCNLKHKKRFLFNGFLSMTYINDMWVQSFDCSEKELEDKIHHINVID